MPRYLCPTIPSPSLEGNPLDSPNERELHIYLPPGYHEQTGRRYPVLYFLHGYGSGPPTVPPRRRLQEAVPRPLRPLATAVSRRVVTLETLDALIGSGSLHRAHRYGARRASPPWQP